MSDGLVKIIVDKDELVNTQKGPIWFRSGQVVDVEPWIASSLVGRNYAHYPEAEENVQALPENLETLTVAVLRTLASERGIEGYNMMKKSELLEALGPSKVAGVEPPDEQAFEKIKLLPDDAVLKEPSEADEKFDGE